jgi:hypothetical protein
LIWISSFKDNAEIFRAIINDADIKESLIFN